MPGRPAPSLRRRPPAFLRGYAIGLGCVAALRLQASPVTPAPLPTAPTPVHITDAQDRLMSGKLSPSAEAKSQANALYAQAMRDGPESHPHEALEQLRQVVALDPHFADAQAGIANILLQEGQVQKAMEHLQQAVALNPDSAALQAALGYAHKLRGENTEALRLSTAALTKDATLSVAMRVLLELAGDRDELADGVTQVETILRQNPKQVPASAWLALAKLYVEVARGDVRPPSGDEMLKTLLSIYQEAAAKTPPEAGTLTLLADTYRNLGQKEEALKTLRKAAALEPSNVDILLNCAEMEMALDETARAIDDYALAYTLNPNLMGLRQTLIRAYFEVNRFADAIPLLQEALATTPGDFETEIDLGLAYEGTHQHEKAEACFQHVFADPSCPPEAYLKLALSQLSAKHVKEAGATMGAALKRFPDSTKIMFYSAVQMRYAKNYEAALAQLARIRAIAAKSNNSALDVNFYIENALILNLAGKQKQIEPVLREALSQYPDNPDVMNELAYFWAEAGRHLPEAAALSKQAITLSPDSGPILDTRGWVYVQLGRPKDALPYLQRAVVLTNNDPVVLQHLGDAYLKLGRRRDALAAWRRALEQDPGNSDLINRIDATSAQATNAHTRSAPNK